MRTIISWRPLCNLLDRRGAAAVLAIVSLLLLLGTALMGFAHTRAGRPVLAWLGRVVGQPQSCPLGFDVEQSPAAREETRRRFAKAHGGAVMARSRPALGFSLDHQRREDLLGFAASHKISCERPRAGGDLECRDIPAALLPPSYGGVAVQTLWLNFGGDGTLIGVTGLRRERDPEVLSVAFRAIDAALTREVGAAAARQGDPSAAALGAGLLRQASVEYRFRDYHVELRITNMGDGYLLTEEYRSLPL